MSRSAGRLAGLVLLCLAPPEMQAQPAPAHEYQVKAICLFNFAHFVEWPASAFPSAQTPLVIGVLGPDPFGTFLDEALRDEKAGGRALVVQRYRRLEDIGLCHILFIGPSESGRLEQITARLEGRSILTVSDAEGFALRGVMIRFLTENNKVRLKINLGAAKAAGLTLSSKLLRSAEIVATGRN
jgi:hypothetical protein